MKTQTIAVLTAVLLIASLVRESDCWHGTMTNGKLGEKFKRATGRLCHVARSLGCGGMEQSVYDDRSEDKNK